MYCAVRVPYRCVSLPRYPGTTSRRAGLLSGYRDRHEPVGRGDRAPGGCAAHGADTAVCRSHNVGRVTMNRRTDRGPLTALEVRRLRWAEAEAARAGTPMNAFVTLHPFYLAEPP